MGNNACWGSGAGSLKLGVGGKQGCRGGKKPGGNVTEKLEHRIHTGVTWVEGRMLGRSEPAPPVRAQLWKPERLSLGCRACGLRGAFPPVRSLRSHTCAEKGAFTDEEAEAQKDEVTYPILYLVPFNALTSAGGSSHDLCPLLGEGLSEQGLPGLAQAVWAVLPEVGGWSGAEEWGAGRMEKGLFVRAAGEKHSEAGADQCFLKLGCRSPVRPLTWARRSSVRDKVGVEPERQGAGLLHPATGSGSSSAVPHSHQQAGAGESAVKPAS